MFDAEGAEITTNIAVKNRHKFKLSTDYHYVKLNATSTLALMIVIIIESTKRRGRHLKKKIIV